MNEQLNLLCANCGLTWGAHRANPTNATCPAHQGRMDFEEGPGTVFVSLDVFAEIPRGTPASKPTKVSAS